MLEKSNIFIAVLIISYLSLKCKNNSDPTCLEKSGMNSADWIADSFGCRMYRYNNNDKIEQCKDFILTKDSNFIKDYFGEPNYRNGNAKRQIFVYIIEPSWLCIDSLHFDKRKPVSASAFYFDFDQSKLVTQIGATVP